MLDDNAERAAREARGAVEAARLEWERSSNPVYPWIAYLECRTAGIEIPEWVLHYLDGAATGIWRLFQEPPIKNKVASAVADALGFKTAGAGSAFSRAKHSKWVYFGYLADLYMRQGDKEYVAFCEVADRAHVSTATVRRAWQRYRETFFNKS